MTANDRRANLLMWCSAKLDYYTPRKDSCKEHADQFEYYTKMMKFLVTKYDTATMRERPQGTNLVFPSL